MSEENHDISPGVLELLQTADAIRQEDERIRMVSGSEFSLFKLGLFALQENDTSKILVRLFDPRGSHGQGVFFLRNFISLLPFPRLFKFRLESVTTVERERCTIQLDENRRMDVFIASTDFFLAIENKLDAEDGEEQCSAYLKNLEMEAQQRPFFLVYLTPEGRAPGERSLPAEDRKKYAGNFCCLSWLEVIESLEASVGLLPAKIGYFISDFCKALNTRIRGKIMTQDAGIVNFLANQATSAELKSAFELMDAYIPAGEKLILDWLERLKSGLDDKITGTIHINKTFTSKESELDFLQIHFPALHLSIWILSFSYRFGGVPSYTLLWGEAVNTWEFETRELALADPWIREVMKEFKKEQLTGNMLAINRISDPVSLPFLDARHKYLPLSPDFLIKIRDESPAYLLDPLFTACKNLERLEQKHRNQDANNE